MKKEIEKAINMICSDWAPQDNNRMKRVLDKNKKSILLEQIIEPLLNEQREVFNKIMKDFLEKGKWERGEIVLEEGLKELLK